MTPKGYRFSMDPFLLAYFIRGATKNHKVIDLGSGSGIILFLLRKKEIRAHYVGLEKQGPLVKNAQKIKIEKGVEGVSFIQGDIRNCHSLFPKEHFDLVLSNPPYRKKGTGRISPDPGIALARHEIEVELKDILFQSSYLLKPLGRVFLIYHPTRLEELLSGMEKNKIHPERIRFAHSFLEGEAMVALVEGTKLGKGALKVEPPLVVFDEKGEYSREMKEVYGRNAGKL